MNGLISICKYFKRFGYNPRKFVELFQTTFGGDDVSVMVELRGYSDVLYVYKEDYVLPCLILQLRETGAPYYLHIVQDFKHIERKLVSILNDV